MVVGLVFFTFVVMLTAEFFLHRYYHRDQVPVTEQARERKTDAPRLRPNIAAGFAIPDNVRYHPGHTWALSESTELVRVGIDDFAAKFLGTSEKVQLPQRGQWVRQGQKIFGFVRDGKVVDLVSPIEGAVSAVNEAVLRDPDLAHKDCYGEGWLLTVQAPDAKTMFRNLMGGALVRHWMEETAARLASMLPNTGAMALAQDGGTASHDIGRELPEEKFAEASREFFLS
jgi:glycine cleavage system H lipoate-binding protein